MAQYCINSDGVKALLAVADSFIDSSEDMKALTLGLLNSADTYSDTLGPHYDSLVSSVTDIKSSLEQAKEPVEVIAGIFREIADAYEEIMGNDFLSAPETDSGASGESTKSTHSKTIGVLSAAIGRIFHPFGKQFEGLSVGKNGFVKGNNYDRFISVWEGYDISAYTYTDVRGDNVTEMISAGDIEGIRLGDTEISDSDRFWGMHSEDKELYSDAASHIPAVKEALDSGRSIEELKEDPVLGTCTSMYFDPEKMIKVIKNDGFYEFESDGRHRIIAAREHGFDIPVKIVGILSRRK